MVSTEQSPNGKFDFAALLKAALDFESYWRLMLILFLLGVLASLVAYVFARPTYSSTAIVRVYRYLDTTKVAMQPGSQGVDWEPMHAIGGVLMTPYTILEAAKKVGLASSSSTYRGLRDDLVPKVNVGYLDGDLIEISIEAFSAKAVEDLPEALLNTFEENRQKTRVDLREKAIQKYMDELAVMRQRVTEQLDARLKFEEDSALATTQIELDRMSDVPVRLIKLKHRMEEMMEARQVLERQAGKLDLIEQLSLLTATANDSEDKTDSGRLVRPNIIGPGAPGSFQNKTLEQKTEIVVQPNMVEGLVPWKVLEKNRRSLEERLRMERLKYRDDHQVIKDILAEIRQNDSALELELEVARKAFDVEQSRLREQVASLEAKLPEYHKAVKNYDEKKLGYELMQRSQLAWDAAYERLAKQIEGFEMDTDDSKVRLEFRGFSDLRNVIPVSPSKGKLAIIGLLLGLGLAIGVPFGLQKMDSSVNSLAEFEAKFGVRGIGLVPRTDIAVLNEVNRSPSVGGTVPNALLENFRLIRSAIMLNCTSQEDGRVIMVTSARPGEGKTSMSCNIGWAFSSIGEKTLVIDCDLRRGRVCEIAGVDNHFGMTNLLMGDVTLSSCIKQVAGNENLSVITRGPIIQGTTELLNTAVFAELLKKLKVDFQRIILDTPPVLGLSETAFLQNYASGVVFVVRAQRTMRQHVIEAITMLKKAGANIYGFVLNDVDFTRRANAYQYYYYSSNYYDLNWESKDQTQSQPTGET
jgi:succinoglycan biosynthesis transport protein ExoP